MANIRPLHSRPRLAFLKKLQSRTVQAAIGASALRNQGAPGVIEAARKGLMKVRLRTLSRSDSAKFHRLLNTTTTRLASTLPKKARNWGAARKAINLYLRDVVYNRDLCLHFDLVSIRPWLEVPLDKDVANGLRAEPEGKALPEWDSIKRLLPAESAEFQKVAEKIAKRFRVFRVDLDVYFWRAPN